MKTSPAKKGIVTLNLFQGPFLPTSRSFVGQRDGTAMLLTQTLESGARWMLKQVQHDDDFCVGVFA